MQEAAAIAYVGENDETEFDHDATYSPEDNKIRIYPAYRLDRDDYGRLKAAGYKWAPKQDCFVAPMWTPEREDIALEFCGEIGDEDTSLVDRAEMRAERFEGYSENRANDAHREKANVDAIANNIPLGQPILVGHHSEKKARKHAEKIENGMRRAVKMWETSKYWERRAAGAIRHAKYKERPDVRARRIKKIEAERRKRVKGNKEARGWLNIWLFPSILTRQKALFVANYSHGYDLYSALTRDGITAREARNRHVPALERRIAINNRWIAHCDNRLIYEKAMLEEQGAADLLKPKPRPKQPPLLNYRAPEGIESKCLYHRGEVEKFEQVEMTKDEYKRIWNDRKGTRVSLDKSHRFRIAIVENYKRVCVFLTDSKEHKRPEPVETRPAPALSTTDDRMTLGQVAPVTTYKPPERTEFDDMKDVLRNGGVKTVSAPQLFPTPPDLAIKIFEAADIQAGEQVLEPSGGTGALIRPIVENVDTEVLAYEVNAELCGQLSQMFPAHRVQVRCRDFLEVTDFQGCYDKIIMNPPFRNGEDIKHIRHAMKFLKPGGRLVALCANGPRQRDRLMPLADYWEDLPAGSFSAEGTNVNVAMLTITGE